MSEYRIFGDWGTTRLRLWRIEGKNVVAMREGAGIGALDASPAETLRAEIAPWLNCGDPTRIVLCGMAGARNGLHEVSYVECPADIAAWRNSSATLSFDGTELRIMAGVACREGHRPDVMRGEETQIFGAFELAPALREGRRTVVLPGTHSKWAQLDNGRIATFRTFLTGELYALLGRSSLLATRSDALAGTVPEAFDAGLDRARASGGILGSLFEARAAQLRDGRNAAWAADFISGLLLGGELAEMRGYDLLPPEVSVIGGSHLTSRYAHALARFEVEAIILDGEACALAGLEWNDADD